jgi:hypothetical protein
MTLINKPSNKNTLGRQKSILRGTNQVEVVINQLESQASDDTLTGLFDEIRAKISDLNIHNDAELAENKAKGL